MRGRGGWPAPCAQSISWRRLRVDNAAGVRCQWRASLPCGFWSRRNVVSITGFLAIPRREKLWYLFGAAAGLFPLGCLVLVIGPQPILENLFVLPVLQSSASRHIRSQLWKSRLSFFSSHI